MRQRDAVAYIEDIIKAMDDAIEFVRAMDYASSADDTKTSLRCHQDFRDNWRSHKKHSSYIEISMPQIPMKKWRDEREVIHAYSTVDLKRVWSTLNRIFPFSNPFS